MKSLLALFSLLLMSCAPVAPAPEPAPPPSASPHGPVSETAVSAEECASRGGRMAPVGRRQTQQCVVPYADGGRSCTDGSQCAAGRCIDESPQEAKVAGVCQRTNFQFGCFASVSGGARQATICVD